MQFFASSGLHYKNWLCLVDAPLGVLFDSPHRQHAVLEVLLFVTLLQCHL
jgi:hypothetical protein